MKFLVFLFLLITQIVAQTQTTPLLIGAGPYFQTQPYKGADTKVVPSPVVFFDNNLFYVRWTRVGVYFLGDKKDDFSWAFSLSAEPQPLGYASKDSSALTGMKNKDNSIQGGLGFDMQYKDTFLNSVLFQDLLNKSNSYIARAEVGQHVKLENWDFYPSVMATYHAAKFNDYYYGVSSSEATLNRPVYSPSSSVDLSFETYAKYEFTKKWSTLLNFRADYLGKSEQDSPIISDKYMFSGLISLMYRWEI